MSRHTIRRSIAISPQMHDKLKQIAQQQPRTTSVADLIREAIRRYLDEQEDLIGSRRHFQKSFEARISHLEHTVTFHLTLLTYLISRDPKHIRAAIVAARQHGAALQAQVQAAREVEP